MGNPAGGTKLNATDHLADYERKILANVERTGCHIPYVFGGDDEPDYIPFGYSVGFPSTVGQPEVIVFGFPGDLTAAVINGILRQCRDGLKLTDWLEVNGLIEGHSCILREVGPDNITIEHFNSAIWYSRMIVEEPLDRAFQIVWPGARDGLFPWEDDCTQTVRDRQPALYRTSLNS